MKILLLAVAGASLLAGAAVASPPATKSDPNKKICRSEAANGSRLGSKRICKTAAEWADYARQTREAVDQIQQRRAARLSDDPGGM